MVRVREVIDGSTVSAQFKRIQDWLSAELKNTNKAFSCRYDFFYGYGNCLVVFKKKGLFSKEKVMVLHFSENDNKHETFVEAIRVYNREYLALAKSLADGYEKQFKPKDEVEVIVSKD